MKRREEKSHKPGGSRHPLLVIAVLLSILPSSPIRAQDSPAAATNSIDPYAPKMYYFPFDRSDLLRDYAGNRRMFDMLDSLLHIPPVVAGIDTIQIIAGCSPVGSEEYNRRLAEQRALQMRTYLRWQHLAVAERYPVAITPAGIDWEGYDALRRGRRDLTEKQIWDLLQYASVRLKMKDGSYIPKGNGSPLKSLLEGNRPTLPALPAGVYRDTVYIHRDILVRDTVYVEKEKAYTPGYTGPANTAPAGKSPFRLALKANLLYALALLPNLSVEMPFAGDWSVAVNGAFSKWDTKSPEYWSHQVNYAGLEVRRWWGNRQGVPLNGHFAGIYFTGGVYDLRLFTKSLDGYGYLSHWSWSAGVVYGYSLPLSAKLNIEFSLSAGYFTGEYHTYNRSRCTDCYPERKTGTRNYWGPTGAGVSLVYRFGMDNPGN